MLGTCTECLEPRDCLEISETEKIQAFTSLFSKQETDIVFIVTLSSSESYLHSERCNYGLQFIGEKTTESGSNLPQVIQIARVRARI